MITIIKINLPDRPGRPERAVDRGNGPFDADRQGPSRRSFPNPQINLRIEVESWTTADEINLLQAAIDQGGFNAFETAFTQAKKGTIEMPSFSAAPKTLPIVQETTKKK